MTSNHKRMLQGLLGLAVVVSAAEVRAQDLETPGSKASAPAAPAAPAGPSGFGDGGQLVLSAEDMFGFNYNHSSNTNLRPNYTTFSLFTNPFGVGVTTYQWPRLAFDAFVTKGFSAGGAISFSRTTGSANGASTSTNAFEVAPRIGYSMLLAPLFGIWARGGVTYVYSDANNNFLAVTVDALGAIIASPHLAITFGPSVDVGISGKPVKYTTVGVYFGLAIAI
jgi:hypothetical protein